MKKKTVFFAGNDSTLVNLSPENVLATLQIVDYFLILTYRFFGTNHRVPAKNCLNSIESHEGGVTIIGTFDKAVASHFHAPFPQLLPAAFLGKSSTPWLSMPGINILTV
ncbi:hypothetical protein VNO77_33285 [Canavalia gladiata]|uniref:Uncharacterized protein n=1 Tax=Canavalia gladiata TaxID=3824 RepID=A0AAN9KC41_CANGL